MENIGYEKLVTIIKKIDQTITALKNQIPERNHRDKCGLNFRFMNLTHDGNWQKALVTFGASHGSYGSSSASNDMSEMLAKNVVCAIGKLEREIIKTAINILEKEKQLTAEKAANEAEKIIEYATKKDE